MTNADLNRSREMLPYALVTSLVFGGAIFGFFYAWTCSTMWGLDRADPRVAIIAMQEMNASVRNAVFAPAFFGTPVVMGLTALLAMRAGYAQTARWVGAGALIYLFGGMVLTMLVNVPMNEALGSLDIVLDTDLAEAQRIWTDYSDPWKVWNYTRTVFSGLALVCVGIGMIQRT